MFHLAIPSRDLKESEEFYNNLGCSVGRKYNTHVILDYFGHQLVCHQSVLWDRDVKMYPRHFGVICNTEKELKDLWNRWQFAEFVFEEYFVRHEGKQAEHHTFFLKDPSNNIIEFKWYKYPSTILGNK